MTLTSITKTRNGSAWTVTGFNKKERVYCKTFADKPDADQKYEILREQLNQQVYDQQKAIKLTNLLLKNGGKLRLTTCLV